MDASLTSLAAAGGRASELDLRRLYLEHGGFLWRSLQRLGVRDSDLEDVLQEVLMVVHRRASSFDPPALQDHDVVIRHLPARGARAPTKSVSASRKVP